MLMDDSPPNQIIIIIQDLYCANSLCSALQCRAGYMEQEGPAHGAYNLKGWMVAAGHDLIEVAQVWFLGGGGVDLPE